MDATLEKEDKVWTPRDERELKAEHKRLIRATKKHLGELPVPNEQDRSLFAKLSCRRDVDPSLPLNKRPLPPKATTKCHWWCRKCPARARSASGPVRQTELPCRADDRTSTAKKSHATHQAPLSVAQTSRPYERLRSPSQPQRLRQASEHESSARRRARANALHQLETHSMRPADSVKNHGYGDFALKPGTWVPGQVNAIQFTGTVRHRVQSQRNNQDRESDYNYALFDQHVELTTPELCMRFPLPPTQPLNIKTRDVRPSGRSTHLPPVPALPSQSQRESFLELRKKRSTRF